MKRFTSFIKLSLFMLLIGLSFFKTTEAKAAVAVYTEAELRTALGSGNTDQNINVMTDITLTSQVDVYGTKVLRAIGEARTIKIGSSMTAWAFEVKNGATLQVGMSTTSGTYSMILGGNAENATQSKGMIWCNGGTVTVHGMGIIRNVENRTSNVGGAIYVESGIFRMYDGGKINNCHNKGGNGGGVYATMGTTIQMYGGTISNCTAKYNGGGIYTNGQISVSGGTITSCSVNDGNGGGIYSAKETGDASFSMSGGTISNCSATEGSTGESGGHGGALYRSGGTSCNITGGNFNDNTSNTEGGGIYITDATANLSNITVYNNSADEEGGGIFIKGTDTSVTITSGNIYGNSSGGSGGGIFSGYGATLYLGVSGNTVRGSGPQIYSNEAFGSGGGIRCNGGNDADRGGETYIYGCKVYNNISRSFNGGGISVQDSATAYGSKFTCYYADIFGNTVENTSATGTGGGIDIRSSLVGGTHSTKVYYFANNRIFANHATVGGGINCEGELTINGTNTFSGNGTTGNYADERGGVISVTDYGVVKLQGNSSNALNIQWGRSAKAGGGIFVGETATLQINNYVNIIHNYAGNNSVWSNSTYSIVDSNVTYGKTTSSYGGGINCRGTLYISGTGTSIYENGAYNGGGVSVMGSGSMEMYGNYGSTGNYLSIYSNDAVNDGGGLYAYTSSTTPINVTLSYVSIANNNAGNYGGGISYSSNVNVVSMDKCSLEYNKSASCGGAIWLEAGSIINSVTNSHAGYNQATRGAGMYNNGTIYALDNVSFYNNGGTVTYTETANANYSYITTRTAAYSDSTVITTSGGGIFVGSRGSIKSNGNSKSISGCKIYSNVASLAGGGMYIEGSVVNTSATAYTDIYSNKADHGAGICFVGGGSTISKINVYTNTSNNLTDNRYGAGILVHNGSNTVTNANIYENSTGTTKSAGGGIAVMTDTQLSTTSTPSLVLVDSSVHSNSSYCAGGVYVKSGATAVLNTVNIHTNKVTTTVGGLSCQGTVTANALRVYNNTSTENVNSAGSGIDVFGSLTITGGDIVVYGNSNGKAQINIGNTGIFSKSSTSDTSFLKVGCTNTEKEDDIAIYCQGTISLESIGGIVRAKGSALVYEKGSETSIVTMTGASNSNNLHFVTRNVSAKTTDVEAKDYADSVSVIPVVWIKKATDSSYGYGNIKLTYSIVANENEDGEKCVGILNNGILTTSASKITGDLYKLDTTYTSTTSYNDAFTVKEKENTSDNPGALLVGIYNKGAYAQSATNGSMYTTITKCENRGIYSVGTKDTNATINFGDTNIVYNGGGIYLSNTTATNSSSGIVKVIENKANNNGGGFYIDNNSTLMLANFSNSAYVLPSYFSANEAEGYGDGVYVETGSKFAVGGSFTMSDDNDVYLCEDTYVTLYDLLQGYSPYNLIERFTITPSVRENAGNKYDTQLGRVVAKYEDIKESMFGYGEEELYYKTDIEAACMGEAERLGETVYKKMTLSSKTEENVSGREFVLRSTEHIEDSSLGYDGREIIISEAYLLSYNKNCSADVENMPSSEKKYWNEDIYITDKVPTRNDHYDFVVWNSTEVRGENGSEEYNARNPFLKNEDYTLYAIWERIPAEVTVNHYIMDKEGNYGKPTLVESLHDVYVGDTLTTSDYMRAGFLEDGVIKYTGDNDTIKIWTDSGEELIKTNGSMDANGYYIVSAKIDYSNEINIYYERIKHTVTVRAKDGVSGVQLDGKANTVSVVKEYYASSKNDTDPITVDILAEVEDGYEWSMWTIGGTNTAAFTNPGEDISSKVSIYDEDIVLDAYATKLPVKPQIIINHYVMDENGDYSEASKTEGPITVDIGSDITPDSYVDLVYETTNDDGDYITEYDYYTVNGEKISGDSFTANEGNIYYINIYYKRNKATISFYTNEWIESITVNDNDKIIVTKDHLESSNNYHVTDVEVYYGSTITFNAEVKETTTGYLTYFEEWTDVLPSNYEKGSSTMISAGTSGSLTIDSDMTISAIGAKKPITYTVRYNNNIETYNETACEGYMEDSTFTYNVTSYLTINQYVLPGYKFVGWNTKPDGSGTDYSNGQEVLNLSSTDGEIIDLYAQWDKEGEVFPTIHTEDLFFRLNEEITYEDIFENVLISDGNGNLIDNRTAGLSIVNVSRVMDVKNIAIYPSDDAYSFGDPISFTKICDYINTSNEITYKITVQAHNFDEDGSIGEYAVASFTVKVWDVHTYKYFSRAIDQYNLHTIPIDSKWATGDYFAALAGSVTKNSSNDAVYIYQFTYDDIKKMREFSKNNNYEFNSDYVDWFNNNIEAIYSQN